MIIVIDLEKYKLMLALGVHNLLREIVKIYLIVTECTELSP